MQPAHIKRMVRLFFILLTISLSIVLLLFFPIYVKTDGHYDMNGRKLAFSISLYKFFRVFGGYIATYPGGFAVHVSPKKAILIAYGDLESERKRLSVLKSLKLQRFHITVETGPEYLLTTSACQMLLRIVFFILDGEREKIENNVWLTNGDVLRISSNFTVRFNLFVILRNLTKN